MMKGQVSIEYLIVTAFAFLLALPVLIIFYGQSYAITDDIGSAQAIKIASEIVEAANKVYYLGTPSKKTIVVYMPNNVKDVTFQGKSVIITLGSSAGDYEVVKWSVANLTGNIGSFSGVHRIEVKARLLDVEITE